MIRQCGICDRYFWNPKEFYRCWICLKKDRGWDLTKGDENLDEHITEFDKLYREHQKLLGKPPQKVVKRVLTLDSIAKERVKALLKLCHPDKHVQSSQKSAMEITTWLLRIKNKMK